MTNYEWRYGILGISLAAFCMLILGCLYKAPNTVNEYSQNKAIWDRKFISIDFLCLGLNSVFFLFGHLAITVHIVNYVIERDIFDSKDAYLVITIIGISNLCGRLGLGILSHAFHSKICLIFTLCNMICSIVTLIFTFVTNKICKACDIV